MMMEMSGGSSVELLSRNDAIAKGVLNESGPSIYESRGVLSL